MGDRTWPSQETFKTDTHKAYDGIDTYLLSDLKLQPLMYASTMCAHRIRRELTAKFPNTAKNGWFYDTLWNDDGLAKTSFADAEKMTLDAFKTAYSYNGKGKGTTDAKLFAFLVVATYFGRDFMPFQPPVKGFSAVKALGGYPEKAGIRHVFLPLVFNDVTVCKYRAPGICGISNRLGFLPCFPMLSNQHVFEVIKLHGKWLMLDSQTQFPYNELPNKVAEKAETTAERRPAWYAKWRAARPVGTERPFKSHQGHPMWDPSFDGPHQSEFSQGRSNFWMNRILLTDTIDTLSGNRGVTLHEPMSSAGGEPCLRAPDKAAPPATGLSESNSVWGSGFFALKSHSDSAKCTAKYMTLSDEAAAIVAANFNNVGGRCKDKLPDKMTFIGNNCVGRTVQHLCDGPPKQASARTNCTETMPVFSSCIMATDEKGFEATKDDLDWTLTKEDAKMIVKLAQGCKPYNSYKKSGEKDGTLTELTDAELKDQLAGRCGEHPENAPLEEKYLQLSYKMRRKQIAAMVAYETVKEFRKCIDLKTQTEQLVGKQYQTDKDLYERTLPPGQCSPRDGELPPPEVWPPATTPTDWTQAAQTNMESSSTADDDGK